MSEINEVILVQKAQTGDREAYCELIENYYKQIYSVCYGTLGNMHDAQDAAQETVLKGYLKIQDIQQAGKFRFWILQIARHVAVDQLRRSKNHKVLHEDFPAGGTASKDYPDLTESLGRLPVELRLPLMMYYFDGKNVELIAEHLGLAVSTVYLRLRDGRQSLHEMLT